MNWAIEKKGRYLPPFFCAPGRAHPLGGGSPLHSRHGQALAEGNGFSGDRESEGSRKQSAGATNRKRRFRAASWQIWSLGSTGRSKLDAAVDAVSCVACRRIFRDELSGTKANRPQVNETLCHYPPTTQAATDLRADISHRSSLQAFTKGAEVSIWIRSDAAFGIAAGCVVPAALICIAQGSMQNLRAS
jgi:hypothetical protein